MKKIIAIVLVVIMAALTLTGCSATVYKSGNDIVLPLPTNGEMRAKVEAKSIFWDKNDFSLELYFSLYCLDEKTIEQVKNEHYSASQTGDNVVREDVYVIYLSNNEELVFDKNDDAEIVDYEKNVNAILYRLIPFEEAFSTNYGHTTSDLKINFTHSEIIRIPKELIDSSNGKIFIHIKRLLHDNTNDSYYTYPDSFSDSQTITVPIRYTSFGDNKVILLDNSLTVIDKFINHIANYGIFFMFFMVE